MKDNTVRARLRALSVTELQALAKLNGLKRSSEKEILVEQLMSTLQVDEEAIEPCYEGFHQEKMSRPKEDRDGNLPEKSQEEASPSMSYEELREGMTSGGISYEEYREEADRIEKSRALDGHYEHPRPELANLDSGETARGILEVTTDGFGFLLPFRQ